MTLLWLRRRGRRRGGGQPVGTGCLLSELSELSGGPDLRYPVEGDPEVLAVGGEHGLVRGHLVLGPCPARGPDQRPAAERHPAVVGQQRADQALGEMRQRRGLLPPAGRDEVRKQPLPPLEPVLRLAVL